jgi:hypothetical protein
MACTSEIPAVVEDLLREPSMDAAKILIKIEKVDARALLRHSSADLTRLVSGYWELVQFALGITIVACLFLGSSGKRYLSVVCLLMLGCACFMHWFLSPEMGKLLPSVDFVHDDQASAARDRFRSLASAYSMTQMVQLALGLVLGFGIVKRRTRKRHAGVPEHD